MTMSMPAATSQTTGDVDTHCPCLACGYDLFGCSAAGRCPECNFEIAKSIQLQQVVGSETTGRQLRLALRAWQIAIALGIAFYVFSSLLAFRRGGISELVWLPILALPVLHGVAWFVGTSQLPLRSFWPDVSRLYIAGYWCVGVTNLLAPLFAAMVVAGITSNMLTVTSERDAIQLLIIWTFSSTVGLSGLAMVLIKLAQACFLPRIAFWLVCLRIAILTLIAAALTSTVAGSGVMRGYWTLTILMLFCVSAGLWVMMLMLLSHVRRRLNPCGG